MDIILLILLGLITVFSVINCAIRGRKRSLVRLAFIVGAAVIALFLTPLVSGALEKMEPLWVWEDDSALMQFAALSPTLGAAVHGTSRAIWSLLIYPLVFFLLCLLMTIPVSILNRKTERTQKGSGALIGIAVGVISFSLAFAPLCAAGTMILDTVPEAFIDKDDVAELIEMYNLPLDSERIMSRDHLLHAEAVPGRPMLNYLTTARENGKKVSISKELRNLLTLLPLYKELDGDMTNLPELLPAAADCAEKSAFLTNTADELQDAAKEKWAAGEAFLGYDPKNPDGGFGEFLAGEICGSQTNLTIRELAEKFESLMNGENSPA